MKKLILILKEENGSAILIAVMVLIIASIIGFASSSTSTMEVQISAGERDAKSLFYRAEGAAMQAAQEIENADPNDLIERTQTWLNDNTVNLLDESLWDYDGTGDNDNSEEGRLGDTVFGVKDVGVDDGSSLNMTSSQLHRFIVYGRCEEKHQSAFIEMGYKRRF